MRVARAKIVTSIGPIVPDVINASGLARQGIPESFSLSLSLSLSLCLSVCVASLNFTPLRFFQLDRPTTVNVFNPLLLFEKKEFHLCYLLPPEDSETRIVSSRMTSPRDWSTLLFVSLPRVCRFVDDPLFFSFRCFFHLDVSIFASTTGFRKLFSQIIFLVCKYLCFSLSLFLSRSSIAISFKAPNFVNTAPNMLLYYLS